MKAVLRGLLIFDFSLIIWAFLWSLTLLNLDNFFQYSVRPLNYPYSFTICFFVSLCCSAIAIWVLRKYRKDFNPLLVCFGAFIGLIITIYLISTIGFFNHVDGGWLFWLFVLFVFYAILFIPSAIWAIVNALFLIISALVGAKRETRKAFIRLNKSLLILVFWYFPLIIVYAFSVWVACFLDNRKPIVKIRRLAYVFPLVSIILVPYLFLINTKLPPSLIVPIQIRENWAIKTFGDRYIQEAVRFASCKSITDRIGKIRETGLVEGDNYYIWDWAGPDQRRLNIQLLGEKGTAFVRTDYLGSSEIKIFDNSDRIERCS